MAMLLGLEATSAESREILIVPSADAPFYEQTIEALQELLEARDDATVLRVTDLARYSATPERDPPPAAIITLGSQAAQAVRHRRPGPPVIEALVPRSSREPLEQEMRQSRPGTMLYLDQPIERHIELIRLALPQARRVGVLYGSDEKTGLQELERVVTGAGMRLVRERVEDKSRLISQLDLLLGRIDVLLVTPEPDIYNRHSLKRILLTSYRRRVPMIGLTRGYVRAGALAAVHTTAAQFAAELNEMIDAITRGGDPVPDRYPTRFTVDTNPQVARSLNLPLPDSPDLQRALTQAATP